MSNLGGISEQERFARLRLARTRNVGSITFFNLLDRYGGAIEAIEALPTLSLRGGANRALKACRKQEIEKELTILDDMGASLLVYGDDEYPEQLAQIHAPPPVLTLCGHRHLLQGRCVGIVGSRYSSVAGEKLAYRFGNEIGAAGFVVVSGLARGIDARAHEGSLEHGTIGVMGSGFLHPYPKENASLFAKMREVGLLVSEHSPDVGVQGRLFPARNRIIAGLSEGVLVVEASMRSGSLITARMALELGRDVFAVPGSPLEGRSRGCNQLLKDGAYLVEEALDVLSVLEGKVTKFSSDNLHLDFSFSGDSGAKGGDTDEEELEGIRKAIMLSLNHTPITIDELLESIDRPKTSSMVALTDLELAGRIEISPGGYVSVHVERGI